MVPNLPQTEGQHVCNRLMRFVPRVCMAGCPITLGLLPLPLRSLRRGHRKNSTLAGVPAHWQCTGGSAASIARTVLLGASWCRDLRSSSKATEIVRFPSKPILWEPRSLLTRLFSLYASFTNVSTKMRSTPLKLYNPIPPRTTADGLPPCALFCKSTVAFGNARCNHCWTRRGPSAIDCCSFYTLLILPTTCTTCE